MYIILCSMPGKYFFLALKSVRCFGHFLQYYKAEKRLKRVHRNEFVRIKGTDGRKVSYMDVTDFIVRQKWIFAKTYATRAPHEYIVRGKINGTDEEFLEMAKYIQEKGILMHFWGHPNRYVFSGDYYYWVMKDGDNDPTMIINRAKVEDYKISVYWKGNEAKREAI